MNVGKNVLCIQRIPTIVTTLYNACLSLLIIFCPCRHSINQSSIVSKEKKKQVNFDNFYTKCYEMRTRRDKKQASTVRILSIHRMD